MVSRFNQPGQKKPLGKQSPPFFFLTAAEVGNFKVGQKLVTPEEQAEYFHASAEYVADEDVEVSTDTILEVMRSIPFYASSDDPKQANTSEDWESEVTDAIVSKAKANEPETETLTSVRVANVGAEAFGRKMAQSEALRAEFHTAGDSAVKVKRGSTEILLGVLKEYGYAINSKGALSSFTGPLDACPVPESMPKGQDGKIDKDWRPRTDADKSLHALYYVNEGNEQIKFDWYARALGELPEGAEILKDINDLDAARTGKNMPEASGPYKGKPNGWLKGKRGRRVTHWNAMLSALKKAMAWYFKAQRITKTPELSDIGVLFEMENPGGKDATVTDGLMPVVLMDKDNAIREPYTIAGFNNLRIDAALSDIKRNGKGSLAALKDSTAKGPNKKDASKIWQLTWERYLDNMQLLGQWYAQPANSSAMLSKCAEKENGKATEAALQMRVSLRQQRDTTNFILSKLSPRAMEEAAEYEAASLEKLTQQNAA